MAGCKFQWISKAIIPLKARLLRKGFWCDLFGGLQGNTLYRDDKRYVYIHRVAWVIKKELTCSQTSSLCWKVTRRRLDTIKYDALGFESVAVSWSWDKVLTQGAVKKLREINIIQYLQHSSTGIRSANWLYKFSVVLYFFFKAQHLPMCIQLHLLFFFFLPFKENLSFLPTHSKYSTTTYSDQ